MSDSLLSSTGRGSCLHTCPKPLGLPAIVSWAFSTPTNTGGFTGTGKLTADGKPCCKFIMATWHVAVTKGIDTIINPTLCCSPLSTSEKNHLQTVPSPGADTSWKCKVTASTWNTPQSLPLRQTNPSLKGLNF